jgi:hypothetical protein
LDHRCGSMGERNTSLIGGGTSDGKLLVMKLATI